jgi:hypothetical protein
MGFSVNLAELSVGSVIITGMWSTTFDGLGGSCAEVHAPRQLGGIFLTHRDLVELLVTPMVFRSVRWSIPMWGTRGERPTEFRFRFTATLAMMRVPFSPGLGCAYVTGTEP